MHDRQNKPPRAFLLPAFAPGEVILASDLNDVDRALTFLARRLNLPDEPQSFQQGQLFTADDFNRLFERASRVIEASGPFLGFSVSAVDAGWEHFPVSHGDPLTIDVIHELSGRINSVLRRINESGLSEMV